MYGAINRDYFSTANLSSTHPPNTAAHFSSTLLLLCVLSFHIVLCFDTFAAGTSLNTAAKLQIND